MTPARRPAAALAVALAVLLAAASPAAADQAPGSEDNAAVAVNTEDGASVFRLAFSVRMVANGVVDEDNRAWAYASCTDCQTVALAFQVVLVWNDVNVVVPENEAIAYNDQCAECLTYASATQIVLGFDGPVRFTEDGRRRLAALVAELEGLEDRIGEMTASELVAAVSAAEQELIAILSEELVPVPVEGAAVPSTTTSSTAPGDTTTTTAATPTSTASTTSSTAPDASTTTSSTTSSTTATTTTAPTTTTTAATTTTGGG